MGIDRIVHFRPRTIFAVLAILLAVCVVLYVLIGSQIAGVLGALAAIPIAGSLQVILVDHRAARAARRVVPATPA